MPIDKFLALAFAASTFLYGSAHAQATMDHGTVGHMPASAPGAKSASMAMADGEVKRIDLKAQTITLKHGPIQNLDMPPMTMVFKAKIPALLSKLKPGDKVKFSAEMPNGILTVVALEPAR